MAADPLPESLEAKLDELRDQYADLAAQLEDPAVLADHNATRDLSIRRAALAPVAEGYAAYRAALDEAAALEADLAQSDDPEMAELAKAEIEQLRADAAERIETVKQALVQSDDRAIGSIVMELRAGAGGDEAGLWARDLLTMYQKYAGSKGWKVEELELTADPSVGGIRHAVVSIKGEGVFAELGFESGVHSVKRVPATETQGRIHTSTATVAVLPEPERVETVIDWAKDVDEHITTAQGPGGQNVNKVATAVHMIHRPTGVEVRMQESKSQQQNREKARRLLAARIHQLELDKARAERDEQRRGQIGTGERSEKVRVYRYQDGIVADQRLTQKFQKQAILDDGDMAPLIEALLEQETARRLAEL